MKILAKDMLIKRNQVARTKAESRILRAVEHPFVVGLKFGFQSDTKLYLVLDYVNGGDLFVHLQHRRRFTHEQARLYTAEMVLAFEHLHSQGIAYRDLKPENILMGTDGHICLTDFGLSKEQMTASDTTNSFCGTPEYLAPEIIVNKGYAHAVDWWAIGVLTFEMRCGHSPFESKSQMEMFKRITKRDLVIPKEFEPELQSFIDGLLQVDLTRRLGNMHAGTDDIKSHPYFAGIDWEKYYAQTTISPYQPRVKGPGDASNFEVYPEEPVRWYGEGPDAFGDTFVGF